jgi:type VI secretion system protein ImpJ
MVGKLRLGYRLETQDRGGFQCLGLARIVEIRADNTVILDETYTPPNLDIQVSTYLSGLLAEIVGLLNHRGEAIAARLASGTSGTAAEMTDTIMLLTINRWQPVFEHLSKISTVHPETMFVNMVALAGEIATLTNPGRRAREFPTYRHDQLQPSFAPVIIALRQALSTVLEESAIAIPLVEHRYGIRVAQVPDRSIYAKYSFVLAVKAAVAPEVLVRTFPGQIKIGPVEHIRELVQSALPGITLRHLQGAPRQIPHHTGKAYFQFDRSSPFWRQVATSSNMALHVAGDYPELELELWAIKD